MARKTIFRDLLYNCDKSNTTTNSRLEYARGIYVGFIATIMGFYDPFSVESATEFAKEYIPDNFDERCVPAWDGGVQMIRRISDTAQRQYIMEHYTAMKKAMDSMTQAMIEDDAEKFIDMLGLVQWHERSVLVGSQRMMEELGFTEAWQIPNARNLGCGSFEEWAQDEARRQLIIDKKIDNDAKETE